jgi:uncharacterized protein YbaA (DUF1428 family)
MTYVDGFVLPIATDKLEEYRKIAEKAGKIWLEHGALEYKECAFDDNGTMDTTRKFADIGGAKAGETVIFAYIVYESREHRDAVNAKVMADPRLCEGMDEQSLPFDCKRMGYGGFKAIVEYSANSRKQAA